MHGGCNKKLRWKNRLYLNSNSPEKYLQLMRSVNPLVIPRNHKVEEALDAANKDDFQPLKKLIEILSKPYLQNKILMNINYLLLIRKNIKLIVELD